MPAVCSTHGLFRPCQPNALRCTDLGEDTSGSAFLLTDLISDAVDDLGDHVTYKPDNSHLELWFDTTMMQFPMREALGLADVDNIVLELMFSSSTLGAGSAPRCDLRYIKPQLPNVPPSSTSLEPEETSTAPQDSLPPGEQVLSEDSQQPSVVPAEGDSDEDSSHVPVYKPPVVNTVAFQFGNIAKTRIAETWAKAGAEWKQARNWIPQLYKYLASRLTKLGDFCVICDTAQPVSGQQLFTSFVQTHAPPCSPLFSRLSVHYLT